MKEKEFFVLGEKQRKPVLLFFALSNFTQTLASIQKPLYKNLQTAKMFKEECVKFHHYRLIK
jgi:hypothetical protein